MAYMINDEMLGQDATAEQALRMVEALRDLGYAVAFTEDGGLINGTSPENPVPDAVWDEVLGNILNEA